MNKPQESIADFKHRIALLMRNREGGKVYSIIGAAPAHPCVVRQNLSNADKPKESIRQKWTTGVNTAVESFGTLPLDNTKQHGILKP